ncbi:hypothetical protein V6N11_021704 [Hibiscus sabdariffa]|uniref:Uncharacterized protein n=1 Tax=Hibiscus sabdariffa TaxID=183260 RepID=A0ABR2TH15_9ROSI
MPETIFDDSGLEFVIEDKGTNTYSGYLILTRENPIAVTFLPFKTQKETWDMYVRLIKSPEPKDVVRLCCDGVDDRRYDYIYTNLEQCLVITTSVGHVKFLPIVDGNENKDADFVKLQKFMAYHLI